MNSQSLLGPTKFFANELFLSHFLGAAITRPFPKPASPFGDLMASFADPAKKKPAKPKAKPIEPVGNKKKK